MTRRIECWALWLVFAAVACASVAGNSAGTSRNQTANQVVQLGREAEPLNGFSGHEDNSRDQNVSEGRTFGIRKKINNILPILAFKIGIIMTLLVVLTIISSKGLTIGMILLGLKLGSLLGNLNTGWKYQGQEWPGSPWQPVHVHMHGNNDVFPSAHQQAYSGWSSANDPTADEHYYYKG